MGGFFSSGGVSTGMLYCQQGFSANLQHLLKIIKLVVCKHVFIFRTKPYINGAFVNIREALFPLDQALRGPPATAPVAAEDGRVAALLDQIQVHCTALHLPFLHHFVACCLSRGQIVFFT